MSAARRPAPESAGWPRLPRAALAGVAIATIAFALIAGLSSLSPWALVAAVAGGAPAWLLLSAALNAVSHALGGLVWHQGLRAADLRAVPSAAIQRAHWICRGVSEVLPFQVGEAARVIALRRERGCDGSTWRIIGSIGAFKAVDAVVNFTVAAVVLVIVLEPSPLVAAGALAAGTLVVGAAVVTRGGGVVAGRLPQRAQAAVRELVTGVTLLRSGSRLAAPVCWQAASTALRIAALAALLIAYGAPAEAAPALFALLVLAGIVPLAPGGAGVREAAVVPMLVGVYGLGLDTALAVSLAVQAITLVVALAGASVALASRARVRLPVETAPAPA